MTTFLFVLLLILVYTLLVVYAERKISAFIQDRLGPMEVGYYGLLQTVADLLKLIQKEDIVPHSSDRILFKMAPIMIFLSVVMGFVVVPLGPNWSGAPLSTGLFFLLSIISLDVLGIFVAGWSSNNKYATLGTIRSAVQMFSYEVPLGLSALCVCAYCGSVDLQDISKQQGILNAEYSYGGFLSWNIFRMPLLFIAWIIFFIASLAETNRAPFDLPEAESELVAGYQVEYSGFRWAIIMLAEYALMLLLGIAAAILFWGGWNTPLPNIGSWHLATWTTGTVWGAGWLIFKAFVLVGIQIWVRWTFPRVRIDQLMAVCWKYLTPLALFLLLMISLIKLIAL